MTPLLFFLKISKVYWEKNIGNNKATIGTLTILEVKFYMNGAVTYNIYK